MRKSVALLLFLIVFSLCVPQQVISQARRDARQDSLARLLDRVKRSIVLIEVGQGLGAGVFINH